MLCSTLLCCVLFPYITFRLSPRRARCREDAAAAYFEASSLSHNKDYERGFKEAIEAGRAAHRAAQATGQSPGRQ